MNAISDLALVDVRREGRIDLAEAFYRDIISSSFLSDEIDPWDWFATALKADIPGQPSLFSHDRIIFYTKLGARVLMMPYFQPSLEPDAARVSEMLLLLFEVDPTVTDTKRRVRASLLADFFSEYLEATEVGRDHASDPEVRQILDFLRSREMVDSVDLEDLLRYEEHSSRNMSDVRMAMTVHNDSSCEEENHG